MKEARPVARSRERLARLRRGSFAELIATGLLISKGYRILARRHRTPHGEIDLIAARWGRVAFVEVKRRATMADCEAALTPRQAERIGRAADHWLARHARFSDHEVGLDAILVAPRHLPRHLPNALDRA
jgi:putative endonuclease